MFTNLIISLITLVYVMLIRYNKKGYDAYVIRQYVEPQLVLDDAIDKVCT